MTKLSVIANMSEEKDSKGLVPVKSLVSDILARLNSYLDSLAGVPKKSFLPKEDANTTQKRERTSGAGF